MSADEVHIYPEYHEGACTMPGLGGKLITVLPTNEKVERTVISKTENTAKLVRVDEDGGIELESWSITINEPSRWFKEPEEGFHLTADELRFCCKLTGRL
jgi:hypothetical protein